MNCEYCNKQSIQMVELTFNKKISRNPHLINALDRSFNHSLIRKYSFIPFN